MLGKLSGKDEADGSLDLTRADGRLLVVGGELGGLGGDLLEDVRDERVEDGHRLGGDTSVGVHLLQHSVDVGGVGLLSGLLGLLLVTGSGRLGLGSSLLAGLGGSLGGGGLATLRSGGLGSRRSGLGCLENEGGGVGSERDALVGR